jgi:hypothetical protein
MFRRLDSVSVFRWNLFSWVQSIELVPTSEIFCVLNKNRTMDMSKNTIILYSLRFEVWGSHSSEHEVYCLMRYDAVYFTTHRKLSEIRRNLLPPSSGRKGWSKEWLLCLEGEGSDSSDTSISSIKVTHLHIQEEWILDFFLLTHFVVSK